MIEIVKEFKPKLGWQGRYRDFKFVNAALNDKTKDYTLAVFHRIETFEDDYEKLNSKKQFVYVADGDLEQMLNDLRIADYTRTALYTKNDETLRLQLTNDRIPRDFIRQPVKIILKARFYQVTKNELAHIPFGQSPITEKRKGIFSSYVADCIEMTPKLKKYITTHFRPIQAGKSEKICLRYLPIIKERLEGYVPDTVNPEAFDVALKHNLNEMEFNFLNYFYEKKKSLRNGIGQTFFDIHQNGIGWSSDREWVKEQCSRLIDLGLVKFESRKDCRDGRYTSWYFYDANKNLDDLKHDF